MCIETRSFNRIEGFLNQKGYIFVCELNNNVTYSDYLFRNTSFKMNDSEVESYFKN